MATYSEASQALADARSAFGDGDFAQVLAKYEWFFDHALDEDQASFYGVRLSYCLSEWSRLGTRYPPAQLCLEARLLERWASFIESRNPECFHDFVAIAAILDRTPEAISQFLDVHQDDHDLATSAIRFVWHELVSAEKWYVCGDYVINSNSKYLEFLEKYRTAMHVCESDSTLGGEEFAEQIRGWFKRDVGNLLAVLSHCGRGSEALKICRQANDDIQSAAILVEPFSIAAA